MFMFLRKVFRKKKDWEVVLEETEFKIIREGLKLQRRRRTSRMISRFFLLSLTFLYLSYSITYIINLRNGTPSVISLDNFIGTLILVGSPISIWCIIKWIDAFHKWRIKRIQFRISELENEKRLFIEEIKVNTSYYKIKSILDRYNPEKQPETNGNISKDDNLDKRVVSKIRTENHPSPVKSLPASPRETPNFLQKDNAEQPSLSTQECSKSDSDMQNDDQVPKKIIHPGHFPLIVDGPKSILTKMIDLLLGWLPGSVDNSYALICKKCNTNNGLVPQNDFWKVRFVCFRCEYLN